MGTLLAAGDQFGLMDVPDRIGDFFRDDRSLAVVAGWDAADMNDLVGMESQYHVPKLPLGVYNIRLPPFSPIPFGGEL